MKQRGSKDTCLPCPLSSLPESSDGTITPRPKPVMMAQSITWTEQSMDCPPGCWGRERRKCRGKNQGPGLGEFSPGRSPLSHEARALYLVVELSGVSQAMRGFMGVMEPELSG